MKSYRVFKTIAAFGFLCEINHFFNWLATYLPKSICWQDWASGGKGSEWLCRGLESSDIFVVYIFECAKWVSRGFKKSKYCTNYASEGDTMRRYGRLCFLGYFISSKQNKVKKNNNNKTNESETIFL